LVKAEAEVQRAEAEIQGCRECRAKLSALQAKVNKSFLVRKPKFLRTSR
jgi:hypothetical protein